MKTYLFGILALMLCFSPLCWLQLGKTHRVQKNVEMNSEDAPKTVNQFSEYSKSSEFDHKNSQFSKEIEAMMAFLSTSEEGLENITEELQQSQEEDIIQEAINEKSLTRNMQQQGGSCGLCPRSRRVPKPSLTIMKKQCSYWNNLNIASGNCRNVQATYGSACTCPAPPKPTCDLCPRGDYTWLENRNYNTLKDNFCVRMVYRMSKHMDYCAGRNKLRVARMCCTGGGVQNGGNVNGNSNGNVNGNGGLAAAARTYTAQQKNYHTHNDNEGLTATARTHTAQQKNDHTHKNDHNHNDEYKNKAYKHPKSYSYRKNNNNYRTKRTKQYGKGKGGHADMYNSRGYQVGGYPAPVPVPDPVYPVPVPDPVYPVPDAYPPDNYGDEYVYYYYYD